MDITLADIAGMIDHSLLHPTMTDEQLREGCEVGRKYACASVCIKPYAVKLAADILEGSTVAVCTVIGFPSGSHRLNIKLAELQNAVLDGATEMDVVVNVGKVLSGDWDYIDEEIREMAALTHDEDGLIKVIFETDYLRNDEQTVRLCEICSEHNVDFVKTSTGFGFVKQPDGKYLYEGATEHDIALMARSVKPGVGVKASGGVRTLDELLKMRELGATRIGASATVSIVAEAKERGYE
jgi:deoxyribose-phosphate aldolase